MNATHGDAVGANFDGYFEKHIDEVWRKYESGAKLKINTQAGPGVVQGQIEHGKLIIAGESFDRPTTADVFCCNSGPFTTGSSAVRNAIIPRLAAGFVRSSLLDAEEQPSHPSTFYRRDPSNHYARLVHVHNVDGKGYAFAYDDVQPDNGEDQSGKVNAGDPVLFSVIVGGKSARASVPHWSSRERSKAVPSTHHSQDHQHPQPGQQHEGAKSHGMKGKLQGLADKMFK